MPQKRFGALSSSQNPQELSLTFTSVVNAAVGALVAFGVIHTVDAQTVTNNLQALTQDVLTIVPIGFAMFHSLMAIWGVIRKFIPQKNAVPTVTTVPPTV